MADINIIYNCQTKDGTTAQVYLNEIYGVSIELKNSDGNFIIIALDKSTAIRFHRELKKQISFIQEIPF
jgi:hypothetical protein